MENVAAIEPKTTLSQMVQNAMGIKKVIPGDSYAIVISTIHNYQKLSRQDKNTIKDNSRKIAAEIQNKFSAIVVYVNAGSITIIFPKRINGNSHLFGGDILVTNGCITSFILQVYSKYIENLWFITNTYGETDKKGAFSYLLLSFRRSEQTNRCDYIKSFSKEELSPVIFKKLNIKLDYLKDLIGEEYDKEDDMGYFTKYKKVINPESKFGFDRSVKHIRRNISINKKDIDYIMNEYV